MECLAHTPHFISTCVSVRVPDCKSCGNHTGCVGRLSVAVALAQGSAEAGKWPETKALLRVKRQGLRKVTGQEGQHLTAACSAGSLLPAPVTHSRAQGPEGTLVASPG